MYNFSELSAIEDGFELTMERSIVMAKKTEAGKSTEPHRGRITRGIKRTLSTGQFETLVIEISLDEEIEWSSISERQKKIDAWTTVLLQDFKESSDRILSELGITNKKAYFKNPTPATIEKYSHLAAEDEMPTKKVVERGLDLDDLDTVG